MNPLATYSFLPWLRQGLANRVTAADGDPSVQLRATVHVELDVTGRTLDGGTLTGTAGRDVALYGPGDVVGIDRRTIVRTEPRNWVTDFEPNYLPHVEFYDAGMPWRYTPAAPDSKGRLRPWIALVVLAEDEFTDGRAAPGKPLPFVDVPDPSVFPPAENLWAWAHVHVDRSLAGSVTEFSSSDMAAVIPRLEAVFAESPDLGHARLLSPRKLAPSTAYHAFVMPAFETGRRAGLGLEPDGAPHATFSAWAGYPSGTRPEGTRYPYYHRWFFRTGTTGDFESLVRLLEPKPVDGRVGRRPVDVLAPGSNLPPIDDADLHGVLVLGGALRVPRANYTGDELAEVERYEQWGEPRPHPFQSSLARLINLADDYAVRAAGDANAGTGLGADVEDDPDPIITPPLYGTWHALTRRLLVDRDGDPADPDDNWVHDLNLDPPHRVAAGFGTDVVQDHREAYLHAAWEQIGDVLEANRRIRQAQLAREVSAAWHLADFAPLLAHRPEQAFTVLAPLARRVVTEVPGAPGAGATGAGAAPAGLTVHQQLLGSYLQPVAVSPALRRILRPRSRLMRQLPFDAEHRPAGLLGRIGAGEVSAAPPKVAPPEVVTDGDLADRLAPGDVPGWLRGPLRRLPWLRWLPQVFVLLILLLMLLLGLIGAWLLLPLALAVLALWLHRLLGRWSDGLRAADLVGPAGRTPAAVDRLPASSDFVLSEPGSGFKPRRDGTDSVEAARFKEALRQAWTVVGASAAAGATPRRTRIDPAVLARELHQAVEPRRTIPRRVLAGLHIPPRLLAEVGERFVEVMAYPEFDTPMYEPLVQASAERFLPNINLIEENSITLLESNQAFVEAYLVGLNHEFARVLLGAQYPTDQRGSYCRQFWDPSGYLDESGADAETLRERLRDIPPLHRWPRRSGLGDHDHRGGEGEEVVLVVRGELLKRYPNAVIYAHRACWQRTGPDGGTHPCLRGGPIDNTRERRLEPLTAAEEADPPRSKLRTPLYEARVDPDISFFGFDLTVEEAQGGTGADPGDDPGWFFVIEERPGEPRFGLDIDQQPALHTWNDLSWEDVLPGAPGAHLRPAPASFPALVTPVGPEAEELGVQHEEDRKIEWDANATAAELAYVLLQVPVRVAVHASEMLTRR